MSNHQSKSNSQSPLPHAGEGQGEGPFFRPFKQKHVKMARRLRRAMTEVEKKLWYHLRDRRFEHLKFRRQYPVGKYVVDFICIEKNLIIELDGGQHADSKKDEIRDAWLGDQGYRILRFWNNEMIENTEGILQTILSAAGCPHPYPLPHAGEGETGAM